MNSGHILGKHPGHDETASDMCARRILLGTGSKCANLPRTNPECAPSVRSEYIPPSGKVDLIIIRSNPSGGMQAHGLLIQVVMDQRPRADSFAGRFLRGTL